MYRFYGDKNTNKVLIFYDVKVSLKLKYRYNKYVILSVKY